MVRKGRIGRKRGLEERKALRRGVTSHMAVRKPSPPLLLYPLGLEDGEVESESSLREVTTSSEAKTLSDRGSCVNIANERLVKKLPTIIHPRPYRLQWLSEKGEFLVNNAYGGYTLTARGAWQFDKKMIHDGVIN
ncbi:hypothetical protein CR513_42410, partial [Mucuna pruriens]